jgi:hypothetical protein
VLSYDLMNRCLHSLIFARAVQSSLFLFHVFGGLILASLHFNPKFLVRLFVSTILSLQSGKLQC